MHGGDQIGWDKKEAYQRRIDAIRKTKEAQTREKLKFQGYMDTDDYGTIPPPEGFGWKPKGSSGEFFRAKAWSENFRSLMQCYPAYIDPNDAIAGRTVIFMSNTRTCSWNPAYSYAFLEEDHKKYGIQPGIGADAHFAADYRIGLALGYNGILEKVRRYRDYYGEEKREFYDAEESVVLGIKEWIKRNADQALEASKIDSDPIIKSRLEEVWRVCSWVMENPPRTLHEACQWIAFFNSASRSYNRDGAGCQLDEILRPYYEADIASGSIDDEDAIFLLACLLLNDPHYYQLGGPDQDGRDLISHISFLILEAASRLGSTVNLTVRVHDGLDKEFFRQAVKRLFIHRKGWPRFAGDKALSEGFARNGYPIELGRRRIATGCNWMAIPGIEYCM
ncbi:MAG: pyruvate formate lyase family protein, partial [Clostridiales bacterium]|nr:pyruvate formate lyase family protein [Clostridiales bacterium]